MTDPDSNTTGYVYDADNELQTVSRADGTTLRSGYDADGNLTSQTDGANNATTYGYDPLDRMISASDPLNRTASYTYDGAGDLKTTADALNRTTSYGYDTADRLTSISYSDGVTPGVTLGYYANGQRKSMTDGTGTTSYVYDSLDRLTSLTNGANQQISYGYDLANNNTSLTYPNGKTVTRGFDTANRLQSITDWLNNKTTFAYDPDSDLLTTTFPSATGNVDSYTSNDADQLIAIAMAQGSSTLASLSYGRDPMGHVSSETETGLPGPSSTGYTYTKLNQLATAGTKSYGYDTADNLTELDGNTGYVYDKANELTSSPYATYTYDQLGNRISATPTGKGANTYAYDQASRMTKYTPATGTATTFAYNGDGVRTSATTGTSTSTFASDPTASVPLTLTDGQNSYIYGPDGLPIEQITTQGTPTYLHHDQLGSTRLLTTTVGGAAATYTFNPYGTPNGTTGTATTPFRYAGQYTDASTDLQYDRARYYNPGTGQFISRDPIEQMTREPYSYANDNPLNFTDPSGLDGILGLAVGPNWGPDVPGVLVGVARTGAHLAVDAVTDPFYLAYWDALDLNGAIHAGLGELFGQTGCDIANVVGSPLVPIQAVGLGVDVGGDWIKQHVLGIPGYRVGDERIPNAYLLGSQIGPLARNLLGINWRHDFPGVDRSGHIDWWW